MRKNEHDVTTLQGSIEARSEKLILEYGAVLDSVILLLGLTHDSAIAPVMSSTTYTSCLEGTLDLTAGVLFSPFSVPYVLIRRVYPIVEELKKILLILSSPQNTAGLTEALSLYKHKVIQFMRCYAIVARFCPKFYLAPLFEWLIAQAVEVTALVSGVMAAAPTNTEAMFPRTRNACLWVQQNAAFVLCFIRGSHFQDLLSTDYEQGIKAALDSTVTPETEKSSEAILELMEGLRAQMLRLEQQEELYIHCVRHPDPQCELSGVKFYRLSTELLREPSWNTVQSLCISPKRVPELDTVVAPLFRIFEAVSREMDLVHWAIDKDIGEGIKEANLLFRTPSTATRLLRTVFFNEEGTEFLRNLIGAPLRRLTKQKYPVELDPFRLPFDLEASQRDDLLKANAKFLQLVAGEILQSATKMVESVPLPIRKFLLYARNTFMSAQQARETMHEDQATKLVVASLFFLRFVCPAIVTPHTFGVFDSAPSPEVQRGLILLGKVLQSTASGVEFDGTKEEYMSVCNVFVKSNQGTIMKLYNSLIDAQSIGVRELKLREKAAKSKAKAGKKESIRLLQVEFEGKVSILRDCALLVNEFGLKQSFLPMFRSGGADPESVRTARSLIKLDVKLHEQRSTARAEHILARVLQDATSPYTQHLHTTLSDFADYLPSDLGVFNDFTGNHAYSDTSPNVGTLTHPLLLLDYITAHRPSRLAAIARMLRSSCQEVWEAGIALRDLSQGAAAQREYAVVADQDAPLVKSPAIITASMEEGSLGSVDGDAYSFDDDSDTQSSAQPPTLHHPNQEDSAGRKAGSKLLGMLRGRSGSFNQELSDKGDSASSSSPSSDGAVKNSLSGLIVPSRNKPAPQSGLGVLSPFQSPATLRKKKALKKRGLNGVGTDESKLWAPALVLPQVLGLLHFLTVLRHTLKHARLENRVLMETPDVDSVLANCVFEYSKLAKQAGQALLTLALTDPTNPEVGSLGLAIANAGVLVTKSCLFLMNVDRQVLRGTEPKSKSSASSAQDDNSSSGPHQASARRSISTPRTKTKKLQKSGKDKNLSGRLPTDLLSARDNPLAGVGVKSEEDSLEAES